MIIACTLKGCQLLERRNYKSLAPLQGADDQIKSLSGGLRPPATILQPFGLPLVALGEPSILVPYLVGSVGSVLPSSTGRAGARGEVGEATIRPYVLRAINVRTNHVHTVVTAMQDPDQYWMRSKHTRTERCAERPVIPVKVKPWASHGSTVYLWREKDVAKAIEYGMLSQGDQLFRLDD
jgi:hypothetical protein